MPDQENPDGLDAAAFEDHMEDLIDAYWNGLADTRDQDELKNTATLGASEPALTDPPTDG